MLRRYRWLLCALLLSPVVATAQSLPVAVSVTPDSAQVRVGNNPANPLAELNLAFDDASGLSAASLGVQAQLVVPSAPALLARLPSTLTTIPGALPLLLTVEPPLAGGLSFQRRVHVDVHTHALNYVGGSRFRLFKAPLGGAFRDITTAVEPGSVRTRGTTGGFSQFVIVADLRPTDVVVAEKIAWLRTRLTALPIAESAPISVRLDQIENALADDDFAAAIYSLDKARQRVSARAGTPIPDGWVPAGNGNVAGDLLAGLDTLAFSIGFLRDYGP